MIALKSERHFDWHAKLILVGVTLFVCIAVVNTIIVMSLPGDGWLIPYSSSSQTLGYFMGNWTTPLREGDIVIAVDNVIVQGPAGGLVRLQAPAGWGEGELVNYTVQRGAEAAVIPVRLHRLDAAGILLGIGSVFWDELPQWSWFIIAVIVFFLRPSSGAARLLLIAGTCFIVVTKVGWAANTISLLFAPVLLWFVNGMLGSFWSWLFFPALLLLLLSFPQTIWPLTRFPRLSPTLIFGLPFAIAIFTVATGRVGPATVLLVTEAIAIFVIAITVVSKVRRNRDNPIARAQVSWLALGIAVSIGGTLVVYLSGYFGMVSSGTFWMVAIWPLSLALPLCLAIAILRYRLFDINLIIRRTVTYAFLTALLAAIYFGLVLLLQTVIEAISGQQSPLAIVISTLGIAALFSPLRRRVQTLIDRRFFRSSYDSQQVLAEFARKARDELSLDALMAELTQVLDETVRPEQIVVWVERPEREQLEEELFRNV